MDDEKGEREEPETRGFKSPKVQACPTNWLTPVVLLTLREWNSYGYKLMEQATAFGFEAMIPGSMYRTLRQMEKEGIVKSSWETSKGGPARRMYSITDAGEAYLDFWVEALEQYRRSMDTFFRLYTDGSRRPNEQKDK